MYAIQNQFSGKENSNMKPKDKNSTLLSVQGTKRQFGLPLFGFLTHIRSRMGKGRRVEKEDDGGEILEPGRAKRGCFGQLISAICIWVVSCMYAYAKIIMFRIMDILCTFDLITCIWILSRYIKSTLLYWQNTNVMKKETYFVLISFS